MSAGAMIEDLGSLRKVLDRFFILPSVFRNGRPIAEMMQLRQQPENPLKI
jgi:hypothetical protein